MNHNVKHSTTITNRITQIRIHIAHIAGGASCILHPLSVNVNQQKGTGTVKKSSSVKMKPSPLIGDWAVTSAIDTNFPV